MTNTRQLLLLMSLLFCAAFTAASDLPSTRPTAPDSYARAAAALRVDCPANSNDAYPGYPPLGTQWDNREADAWAQNGDARRFAEAASLLEQADWTDVKQIDPVRQMVLELGDAALYQHFNHNDADAIDTCNTLFRIAAQLKSSKSNRLIAGLLGQSSEGATFYRLEVIISDINLAHAPNDSHPLLVRDAQRLISNLLQQDDPKQTVDEWGKPDGATKPQAPDEVARQIETFKRLNAERTLAAMSLACHVYRFDHIRWPASGNELVPNYLPKLNIDSWGDGTQTFGYVVIAKALPGGEDRPLVYSRCGAKAGLFFHREDPRYGFYIEPHHQPSGGQFRDVAAWHPDVADPPATTQAIEGK